MAWRCLSTCGTTPARSVASRASWRAGVPTGDRPENKESPPRVLVADAVGLS